MKVAISENALRTTERSQMHIKEPAMVKDEKNPKAMPSAPWDTKP